MKNLDNPYVLDTPGKVRYVCFACSGRRKVNDVDDYGEIFTFPSREEAIRADSILASCQSHKVIGVRTLNTAKKTIGIKWLEPQIGADLTIVAEWATSSGGFESEEFGRVIKGRK